MATQSATNVTRLVTGLRGTQLNIGGLPMEHFRVTGLTADTAVVTPGNIKNITGVIGPVAHNLTTNVNTNVTVTLLSGTVAGTIDFWIIGPVNTSN